CRFNDRSASSSSLRNRSFSACAFSSCRRRVSTCRVSSSILADSLDSLPLIQFKVTKLAGFVHCLVKISRFHKALNPVNKYHFLLALRTSLVRILSRRSGFAAHRRKYFHYGQTHPRSLAVGSVEAHRTSPG